MNEILVSVIIPVYNVEKYLPKCLESVINQTLKQIEIICVDDGSTDNSLNILNEYAEKDKRIKVLTQKNLYAGVARNTGLKIAKGKYLSFLDSDDIFELTMLEEMYKKAVIDNSDVVACGFDIYDSDTNKITRQKLIKDKYVKLSPFKPSRLKDELFDFSSPNAWTKLFRHELFKKYNLEFVNTICCNDFTCVYTALALANRISIINKPFIKYRYVQKSNLTANRNKSADGFLVAAQVLENNLKKFNVYSIYKHAFEVKMRSSFNWELSLCTVLQKEERKRVAKKLISPNLYKILYPEPDKPARPFRYIR